MGFVLPALDNSGIISGAASDGSNVLFADNSNDTYLPDAQPEYVIRGTGASNVQADVGGYPVNFGLWPAGSAGEASYWFGNDPDERTLFQNDVYWSTARTAPLANPLDIASLTFAGSLGFQGADQDNSVIGARVSFDLDGGLTGTVGAGNAGVMEICTGNGNQASCGTSADTALYTLRFTGAVENAYFKSTQIFDVLKTENGTTTSLDTFTGNLHGIFTGEDQTAGLYDAFVGGFNFSDTADNSRFLTGSFLTEREDRITAALLDHLSDTRRALVAYPAAMSIAGMEFSDAAALHLIGDGFWPGTTAENFLAGDIVLRLADGHETIVSNPADVRGLIWGRWDDAAIMEDRLMLNDGLVPAIASGPLFWALVEPKVVEHNLSGRFRTVLSSNSGEVTPIPHLAVQYAPGSSVAPVAIDYLDIEFDVDFSTSRISNGLMMASTEGNDSQGWRLHGFKGQIDGAAVEFTFEQKEGNFGVLTSADGSQAQTIDNAMMSGVFIDKPDARGGTAFTGAFNLETADAQTRASGLFLAEQQLDLRLDTFLRDDLPAVGSLNDNFDSIGLILPANSEHIFFHAFAAVPETPADVVFAEYAFPDLNLDLDTLQFPRVFNHVATLDSVSARDVGGYGIDWGIWEKTMTPGAIAYLDPTDLQNVESGYESLVWAVIHEPDFGSPEGTFTYAGATHFIGVSGIGMLEEVQVIFDVDFGIAGGLRNGYLRICTSGGSECGSGGGTVWKSEVFSSSPLQRGFIPATNVTGNIQENGSTVAGFTGQLTGRFTGRGENQRNDAFLGGFNLYASGQGNDNYVTGVFLSELEEGQQQLETSGLAGLLVKQGTTGPSNIAIGAASSRASSASPVFVHNGFGQMAVDAPPASTPAVEVMALAEGSGTTTENVAGFEVDWGIWDQQDIVVKHKGFNNSSHNAPSSDLHWAVVKPADLADLTGTAIYAGQSAPASGVDAVSMSFSVDFDGGIITDGLLDVVDAANNWHVGFDGQVNGAFASMNILHGHLNDHAAPVTGDIGGVFTGSGTGSTQGFVGGFSLQSGSQSVQGMTLIQQQPPVTLP